MGLKWLSSFLFYKIFCGSVWNFKKVQLQPISFSLLLFAMIETNSVEGWLKEEKEIKNEIGANWAT